MSRISIRLAGPGDCEILHADSGVRIRSSKSPEFGGSGTSFSSTDLLAAALGSCIATDLEPVAERNGLAPASIAIDVEKHLSTKPKRIDTLAVSVRVPEHVGDALLLKLERAAAACLVQRSLQPDIRVDITVSRIPRT
jgi:putative redox protein